MSIADTLRDISLRDDCNVVCVEWHKDRQEWSCMAIIGYTGYAAVSPVLEDAIEGLLKKLEAEDGR